MAETKVDPKDQRIKELEDLVRKQQEEFNNKTKSAPEKSSSVVKFSSPDGPRGYNLNAIFRDRGTSKRPRLDEISYQEMQRVRREDDTEISESTAYDVAAAVIKAAVIQDDSIRNLMVQALADGLNAHISDPTKWEEIRLEWANRDDDTYKSDHRAWANNEPNNPFSDKVDNDSSETGADSRK